MPTSRRTWSFLLSEATTHPTSTIATTQTTIHSAPTGHSDEAETRAGFDALARGISLEVHGQASRAWVCAFERRAPSLRSGEERGSCGSSRLFIRTDLRSLPPLDRPPGPEPLRLVGDR